MSRYYAQEPSRHQRRSNGRLNRATVKQADMLQEMQQEAVNIANEALGGGNTQYMEIAKHVRSHFDNLYGPSWSVVVGRDYGT